MIKAAILDDEIRGGQNLQRKLEAFKDALEVVAVLNNAEEGVDELKKLAIDVLFLDVEMPGLNGFQVLERLGEFAFEVIFTTAYSQYILDALRVSATDYLLKPVNEAELATALERAQRRIAGKKGVKGNAEPKNNVIQKNKIALPTAEGIHLVEKSQIIRIEALSNYSIFILTNNRKIMVSQTLKAYEQQFQEELFLRVNRSTIINLDFVLKYKRGDGGTIELADGREVEVSPQKKDALLLRLF